MSPESEATGSRKQAGAAQPACCPFYHEAVELIGRRWTGAIVAVLLDHGPLRFSEIAQAVPELSDRLLSERMKALAPAGADDLAVPSAPSRTRRSAARRSAGSGWLSALRAPTRASPRDGVARRLGGHDRHGDAELLDARRQVAPEPVRDARRQCRDNHLVERLAGQRVLDGDERISVADDSLDVIIGSLVEQWQRQLERERRLLGVGVPVGPRDEQRE